MSVRRLEVWLDDEHAASIDGNADGHGKYISSLLIDTDSA